MTIKEYLKKQSALIDAELDKYLSGPTPAPRLCEAMRYSVMNGGKRLRPVLLLAVTEALGGNIRQGLPVACALEMIHSYSLIHDDLPAMDNDDLRRGKPTCHKKYDEATAILAGDALQCYTYKVLAAGCREAKVAEKKILDLIIQLGTASGALGMAGGQMLDLQAEKKPITLEELTLIHRLKTGALLSFAVEAPAILFSVQPKTAQALQIYGESIGLAFQIKDDILDQEGSADSLGKTPGKDLSSGKATFVKLLGLAEAKKRLAEETAKAKAAAEQLTNGTRLLELAQYLIERKN
jgi:geranylgeranyl diphosphate synthase, type II